MAMTKLSNFPGSGAVQLQGVASGMATAEIFSKECDSGVQWHICNLHDPICADPANKFKASKPAWLIATHIDVLFLRLEIFEPFLENTC